MDIKISQILFQIINFSIVLYFLQKFIYKPILKMLDQRAKRIQDGVESADKQIKHEQELDARSKKSQAEAKKQSQTLVDEAKRQAETMIRDAEAKAKVAAKAVTEKQREAFEAEMSKARVEFKKQAAVDIAAGVEAVLKNLDVKVQQQLIDKQIKQL